MWRRLCGHLQEYRGPESWILWKGLRREPNNKVYPYLNAEKMPCRPPPLLLLQYLHPNSSSEMKDKKIIFRFVKTRVIRYRSLLNHFCPHLRYPPSSSRASSTQLGGSDCAPSFEPRPLCHKARPQSRAIWEVSCCRRSSWGRRRKHALSLCVQ